MRKISEKQLIALLGAGIGMVCGGIITLLASRGKAKLIRALKKMDEEDITDWEDLPAEEEIPAEENAPEEEDIFEEE